MTQENTKTSGDPIEMSHGIWDRQFNQLEQTLKNSFMENKSSRLKNITYWTATILLVLGMVSGGIAQLVRSAPNVQGTIRLGYPVYLMSILGTWKLLGAIVLLVPKFRLLKEWAYAGFIFELSGAVISHMASGQGIIDWLAPFIFMLLTVLSWQLRPHNRKLAINLID